MRERQGTVWYEERPVGWIRSDRRGAIHFRYHPDWLSSGFPVSIRLPLAIGEDEVNAHGFFQGLLPEGRSRQRVCRQLRLDTDDDAGLLLAIGGDCAGALSILAGEDRPQVDATPPGELDDALIQTLVRSRGEAVASALKGAQRFSLAGAQEKLPVIVENGRFLQPDRNHPSTHILKFETHPHVCFSEYMTLEVARQAGLLVVNSEYRRLDDESEVAHLLIERYDRRRDATGRVHRLHQEDIIQALGYETDFKYQSNGGPGLAQVMALLMDATGNPPVQIQRVIDWQIFNYLVGNSDGHGKNLSLLHDQDSLLPSIAPFYDLVSIEFINQVSHTGYSRDMAFAIGGQYVPERVNRAAWERFAADVGVRSGMVFERLQALAEQLPALAAESRARFAEQFGDKQVYDQYVRTIRKRCRWVEQMLRGGER